MLKFMWAELQRVQILLNKTREEIYRNGLIDRRGNSQCCKCKIKDAFDRET